MPTGWTSRAAPPWLLDGQHVAFISTTQEIVRNYTILKWQVRFHSTSNHTVSLMARCQPCTERTSMGHHVKPMLLHDLSQHHCDDKLDRTTPNQWDQYVTSWCFLHTFASWTTLSIQHSLNWAVEFRACFNMTENVSFLENKTSQ